jgi:hypothetical protein
MITDKLLRVSDEQAVSGNNLDVPSTDFINFNTNTAARDVGVGETLYALFTVKTAPSAGTSVEFQIDVGTVTTGSFVKTETITKRGGIAIANLTSGTQIILPIPASSLTNTTAYALRANYFCSGAIAGFVVSCDIILDAQYRKSYASGYTVA